MKGFQNEHEKKTNKKVIEDIVTFPTIFMIKVIGINDSTFADDMVSIVAEVIAEPREKIAFSTKETSGGKYLSVSISPTFVKSDDVYAAYEAVSKDGRVKFVI